MKTLALVVLSLFTLLRCEKDDSPEVNSNLIGTWLLVEVYADPGDGSGTFEPVDSNKKMIFNSDGTVTSNGILCALSSTSATDTNGIYNSVESTFRTDACNDSDYDYPYGHTGTTLLVYYPCIEGCIGKFSKQ
jgi:hypothetical protein